MTDQWLAGLGGGEQKQTNKQMTKKDQWLPGLGGGRSEQAEHTCTHEKGRDQFREGKDQNT